MTGIHDAAAAIVGQAVMPAAGIGSAMKRPEGRAKVTGAAKYAAEEMPPNTLHAVMVTSTIACGRVTAIDSEAARALPGVIAVLTHADLPKLPPAPVPPVSQSVIPMQGADIFYEGQPVALVLAETLETAETAAGLVAITCQRAPHATFESGQKRAPRRDGNGYAFAAIDTAKGDAEAAFAGAAAVIDQTYLTATRHHNMMEPSATLAAWRGDELHLHDATQWTYGIRYALGALLALPP